MMSPARRKLTPKPPMMGPSCSRRTSWTRPALRPCSSTTSAPSNSLRRMPRSRDPADDMVTDPCVEAAAKTPRQRARAGQDRGDVRRPAALRKAELQVVDLAGEPGVLVEELAVEQVQPRIEHASGHTISSLPW